jgi:hypothetical protein
LAESRRLATHKLGENAALAFHARVADLMAAKSPAELPLGFELMRDFPKRMSILLNGCGYVVFESSHLRDRQAPAHQITTWQGVSRIKMIEVIVQ